MKRKYGGYYSSLSFTLKFESNFAVIARWQRYCLCGTLLSLYLYEVVEVFERIGEWSC